MKLSSLSLLALLATSVSSAPALVRKLEEQAAEEEAAQEYDFLKDHSVSFVACKPYNWQNEDGTYASEVAVVRLCDTCSANDDGVSSKCEGGYADYVMGVSAFVELYLEGERDDNQDQDFRLEEYSECRAYEPPQQDEGRKLADVAYYIAPTCTDDETSIRLQVYSDEDCTVVADLDDWEAVSGMNLPYQDGGLVPSPCSSLCSEYDENNGGYEVSEFCMQLYQASGHCETNLDSFSEVYGKDEGQCELIDELTYVEQKSGKGRRVFLWIFFLAIVAGIGFYLHRQKKQNVSGVNKTGLMS